MTTMDSFPNFSLDGLGLELGRGSMGGIDSVIPYDHWT
jgi:hypothetical protein